MRRDGSCARGGGAAELSRRRDALRLRPLVAERSSPARWKGQAPGRRRRTALRARPMPLLMAAMLGALLAGCAAPSRLRQSDQPRIAGRTFVVTGASSGFGRGVALKLASYGANVVLAARRTEVLEEAAGEVRAAGGQPLVVTTDVAKPEQVERLADAAVERFGRIDVWINNAGIGAIGRFEEIPVEDHARIIDVNFKGVVYGSHAALRQFRRQGAGTPSTSHPWKGTCRSPTTPAMPPRNTRCWGSARR